MSNDRITPDDSVINWPVFYDIVSRIEDPDAWIRGVIDGWTDDSPDPWSDDGQDDDGDPLELR